jgi:hypothetical protein
VPTQVVLGHATFVRRGEDVGDRPPIDIRVLADELGGEFHRSLTAFQDFKTLVAEQIEAISNNNVLP